MEAALTGIRGTLFVCFLLSVVWLSSLRGVRRYGGRHGPGSRLGLLELFVLGFCFRFWLNAKMIERNIKPKTRPAGLRSPEPPFRGLINGKE